METKMTIEELIENLLNGNAVDRKTQMSYFGTHFGSGRPAVLLKKDAENKLRLLETWKTNLNLVLTKVSDEVMKSKKSEVKDYLKSLSEEERKEFLESLL